MTVALVLACCWVLAYFRARLWFWTASLALLLAIWQIAAPALPAFAPLAWAFFLVLAALLNLPPLRRAVLTRPLFVIFKRMLPPLSATEREALEAGTVGWDGDIFSGDPDWRKLLARPGPRLSAEEQAFLAGPVEELCRMLDEWRIVEHDRDLPPEVWQFLKKERFFGMIIPGEYGGLGFSAFAHSQVIMKIASRSVTAAVTVMVPNSLGPAELLLNYGTQSQKDRYLSRLATGDEIPCFALTGPEAGSDAASIPDSGVVCRGRFEGREIIGIRLNWEKRYITLGPVATLLGLAFKMYDPERLLGGREEIGITLALIPTATPGITIGTRHMPLDLPFQNGPNWGRDVFIPMDWIIGGAAGAGQGWRMLMESLSVGRSISLPALSCGGAKMACRAAGAFARVRRQFRLPIGQLEGVEEALGRMAGLAYQMDAARVLTCGFVDDGERPAVLSAIVKYSLTERMRRVVNDAMDVLGGSGISLGPRNLLARSYQAAPIGITVEGANILTRTMIIFGQGAVRSHPFVLKEIKAVADTDPQSGLVAFDQAFFGHVGFTVGTAARTLWLGVTGGRLLAAPGGSSRRLFQHASRLCASFVLVADMSMIIIGSALKRKEKLSGRLADILSNLYLVSAVLKQHQERGLPADEQPLLEWACAESFRAIQEAFIGLFRNFPNRPVAWGLRLMTFPFGYGFDGPNDRLGHQAAGVLLTPSPARDRLTGGMFVPSGQDEPLARLEDALVKVILAEPLEKRLRDAVKAGRLAAGSDERLLEDGLRTGIVTADEAEIVRRATAARREATRVDDFPADYWKKGKG